MRVNVSAFHSVNVTDTCAIWNVLSSRVLYATATSAGCSFCCTYFVYYECLHKPRKRVLTEDAELQDRLRREQQRGQFTPYSLEIEDLHDVAILENRRRLSKGELSSIAFARKIGQAFLTDDQKARRLAEQVMPPRLVQTTPHLLGWLYYTGALADGDKDEIIDEHNSFNGLLAAYFEAMYVEALRCRLMSRTLSGGVVPGE